MTRFLFAAAILLGLASPAWATGQVCPNGTSADSNQEIVQKLHNENRTDTQYIVAGQDFRPFLMALGAVRGVVPGEALFSQVNIVIVTDGPSGNKGPIAGLFFFKDGCYVNVLEITSEEFQRVLEASGITIAPAMESQPMKDGVRRPLPGERTA